MNFLNIQGEFKDDKINGYGILQYSNYTGKYEGTFNDGLREGTGTFIYDGNKYVGKLRLNLFKLNISVIIFVKKRFLVK